MQVEVNYLAVLLAAMSSMVVGSIWYAQGVLGKTWKDLTHLSDKEIKASSTLAMTGAFVAALFTAFILAHVTFLSWRVIGDSFLMSAIQTAFWLWLGFAMPVVVTHGLFEHRRKKLILLTVAYELVMLIVMGVIIGGVGV
jgi:hypothetical protein